MKYGFIGCGNMGGAIARALRKSTDKILLCSKSGSSAKKLAQELDCAWAENNMDVCLACDIIFLAVKPQMMADILAPLVETLRIRKPTLVSMAAGLSLEKLEGMAGGSLPVIRIMPNTPVSIGQGLITYCQNSLVEKALMEQVLADLSPAGRLDLIDEQLMDAATVAAGCSPAYAYMFIDAIAEGAVSCGLPRQKALQYAAAAVGGAAMLLAESGQEPSALADAVCSPGGSTIEGVRVLENSSFDRDVRNAIQAAYRRSVELGKR